MSKDIDRRRRQEWWRIKNELKCYLDVYGNEKWMSIEIKLALVREKKNEARLVWNRRWILARRVERLECYRDECMTKSKWWWTSCTRTRSETLWCEGCSMSNDEQVSEQDSSPYLCVSTHNEVLNTTGVV